MLFASTQRPFADHPPNAGDDRRRWALSDPQQDPITRAVVDTVKHALKIHEKICSLQESLRDTLATAGHLAGSSGRNMHYGTFYELAATLKDDDVPGRGVFTGGRQLAPPPGTVIKRQRGATNPPWPGTVPCVYLLLRDTEVIYVGKTGHIATRMQGHKSKPYTAVHVLVCASAEDAALLEGDLIFQHQPELNRAGRWERRGAGGSTVDVAEPGGPVVYSSVESFKAEWNHWLFDGTPAPLPTDEELDRSINSWVFGGNLNLPDLVDLIPVALDRQGVALEDRYRYFCGVAWRHAQAAS